YCDTGYLVVVGECRDWRNHDMGALGLDSGIIVEQFLAVGDDGFTGPVHAEPLMFGQTRREPKGDFRTVRFWLSRRFIMNVKDEVHVLAAAQQFGATVAEHFERAARCVDSEHVRLLGS